MKAQAVSFSVIIIPRICRIVKRYKYISHLLREPQLIPVGVGDGELPGPPGCVPDGLHHRGIALQTLPQAVYVLHLEVGAAAVVYPAVLRLTDGESGPGPLKS